MPTSETASPLQKNVASILVEFGMSAENARAIVGDPNFSMKGFMKAVGSTVGDAYTLPSSRTRRTVQPS